MSYIANAISRKNLRELAESIRKTIGFENKPHFPIVEFMEWAMPDLFPGFRLEVVDDAELWGKEGETRPHENLIILPNTVYNEAVEGRGRARFSVAHEVSHYILIDEGSIALARTNIAIPKYQQPEWQANALASEILIVPRLSVGMTAETIADVFGVSFQAAEIHLKTKAREYML
jgi:Zn-dependent peptidase ImmA (M78 family)